MSVVRETFIQLREDLDKAYGFGFFPEQDKINAIMESGTLLTIATSDLTSEEYGFYQSASAKFSAGPDTLQSLKECVNNAADSALNLETSAEKARSQFQNKTSKQRAEYLKSGAYKDILKTADYERRGLQNVSERIQNLLFKPVKGSLNPFNDPGAFIQHREAVKDLHSRATEVTKSLEDTLERLTPESLSAMAPEVRLMPSLGKSLGLGTLALATLAAGYYYFAS
jgi:hypothetical protein